MSIELVTARVDALSQNIARVDKTLTGVDVKLDAIGNSLVMLARLEEKHASVQERLTEGTKHAAVLSDRIAAIERVMPGLVETRTWVIVGVMAGVGMIGTAVFKLGGF